LVYFFTLIPKIDQFPYVVKHRYGKSNVIVNALSRQHILLISLGVQILGFDNINELYEDNNNWFMHLTQYFY